MGLNSEDKSTEPLLSVVLYIFLTIVTSSSSNSEESFAATSFNDFEISSLKYLTSIHLAISG